MKVEIIRSARRQKTVSARLDGETLIVRAPNHIPQAELDEVVEKLQKRIERKQRLRLLSDADLEERAQHLNRRYFEGRLQWHSIRWVTNQNSRYVSRTPATGKIRLSDHIAPLPLWVQDYVLVHELAHLLEANHGSRFWALVNQYPRTERARGYLMALDLEAEQGDR